MSPELNTPVGVMVKTGTDPLLLGPDWTKNIELCDHINQYNDGDAAIKAILCQLKSSEQKTVELSMAMLETLMKNCKSVPYLITRPVMEEIVNIAMGRRGARNQDEALRLIQSWGRTFEKRKNELPIFFDTFMNLKSKGVQFPNLDPQDIVASPTSVPKDSNGSLRNAAASQAQQSTKLQQDLKVVLEKVRLCREMLPESPGIEQDEILAEVVGFLEACQERLNDLIEAGSAGVLSENDMEMCFKVHDAVLKTLDAEKNGTPITVDDESLQLFPMTSSGTSSDKKNIIKASLLEEEEEDAFSNLTLKTPSAPSRQIPIIAPPPRGTTSLSSQAPSIAVAPPAVSRQNDDLMNLFPTSNPPPSASSQQNPSSTVPASIGSPGMTDDEFERFLNG